MLNDPSIAKPEAVGVTEIDPAAGGPHRTIGSGLCAGHAEPGYDFVSLRDEILDLDGEVRCPSPQPVERFADFGRPKRLALGWPLRKVEWPGSVVAPVWIMDALERRVVPAVERGKVGANDVLVPIKVV